MHKSSQYRMLMRGGFVLALVALIMGVLAFSSDEPETDSPEISSEVLPQVAGENGDTANDDAELPAPGLISPQQYQAHFSLGDHVLLDVRTPEEFAEGYIEGAQNIPLQVLPENLEGLPRDEAIVVYCRTGNRSAQAARLLADAGFTQVYDLGGVLAWEAADLPLVQE